MNCGHLFSRFDSRARRRRRLQEKRWLPPNATQLARFENSPAIVRARSHSISGGVRREAAILGEEKEWKGLAVVVLGAGASEPHCDVAAAAHAAANIPEHPKCGGGLKGWRMAPAPALDYVNGKLSPAFPTQPFGRYFFGGSICRLGKATQKGRENVDFSLQLPPALRVCPVH